MKTLLIPIVVIIAFAFSGCGKQGGESGGGKSSNDKGEVSGGGAAGRPGTSTNTAEGTGSSGR